MGLRGERSCGLAPDNGPPPRPFLPEHISSLRCRWVGLLRTEELLINPLLARDSQLAGEAVPAGPLRFAFYGRCSTEDNQDPDTSRAWQRDIADNLVRGHGEIVQDYFDISESRSIPWIRRPQASRLLRAITNPNRGFDAVVVGEGGRCWYGAQFSDVAPRMEHFGVEIWTPEVGGRFEHDNSAHSLVMAVTGGMSENERRRVQERTRTAMAVQVAQTGRFQGGRPPYGYLLESQGAHPNPRKAAEGYTLRKLVPDPSAAPVVQWIFEQYLADVGVRAICRMLNDAGVPCPAAHDPTRNRHRRGLAWIPSTVGAIVRNSRYTGFEEWGKFRRIERLLDPDDPHLGKRRALEKSSTPPARSHEMTHEPLITTAQYLAAEKIWRRNAQVRQREGNQAPVHLLRRIVRCGGCERRMQLERRKGDLWYLRCRARDLTVSNDAHHPGNIMVRAERVVRLAIEAIDGALEGHTPLQVVTREPDQAALDTLEVERAELRQRHERLVTAYEHGLIPIDELTPRIAEIHDASTQIDRRIELAAIRLEPPEDAAEERLHHLRLARSMLNQLPQDATRVDDFRRALQDARVELVYHDGDQANVALTPRAD